MKVRVLALDGGGVRGIIPAAVLQYIEEQIIELTNDPNARLSDYIDFTSGTSTGSIIASMIITPDENGRPKYKMEDIVAAYIELADVVFKKNFWRNITTGWGVFRPIYSIKGINSQLLKKFGDCTMEDLLKPCAITGYDTRKRKPMIFTNRDRGRVYSKYFIKDVVRGSTSIPAFFEPVYFKGNGNINTIVDGGTFANNPSIVSYVEILKTKEITCNFKSIITPNDMFFLSFGTGLSDLTEYSFQKIKRWGILKWFVPILNILLQSVSEVTNYEMKKLFETNSAKSNYFRINPIIIHGSSKGDDGSKENMNNLLRDARNYIEINKTLLNFIAKKLIENGEGTL